MSIFGKRTKAKAPDKERVLTRKELAPEFSTILANIKSLVSQLEMTTAGARDQDVEVESPAAEDLAAASGLQNKSVAKAQGDNMEDVRMKLLMGEALSDEERLSVLDALGAAGGGAPVEMAGMPDEDVFPEDEEVVMAKAETGSTGSANADERVDSNQEETTDEALTEVTESVLAKAIMSLSGNKVEQSSPGVEAVLAKALEPIAKAVAGNSIAIKNMLDALGFAQEVVKENAAPQAPQPVGKSQTALTRDEIGAVVREAMGQTVAVEKAEDGGNGLVEPFSVRKSSAGTPPRREGLKTIVGALAANGGNGRM